MRDLVVANLSCLRIALLFLCQQHRILALSNRAIGGIHLLDKICYFLPIDDHLIGSEVIGPRLISEQRRDLIASLHHAFQHVAILRKSARLHRFK